MSIYPAPTPTALLAPTGNLVQSPYLYLNAVGSNGKDGSSPGCHLRWAFARELAQRHLPKGINAGPGAPYASNLGYNKADDHVYIFRTAYTKRISFPLNMEQTIIGSLVEVGTSRTWTMTGRASATLPITSFVVRFLDIAGYDAAKAAGYNPVTNRVAFLKAYRGVLEIEPMGRLSFAVQVIMRGPISASTAQYCLKLETISAQDLLPDGERLLSSRNQYCFDSIPPVPGVAPVTALGYVVTENIQYIRFECVNGWPGTITFEIYDDFIRSSTWSSVGPFSLSLDRAVVQPRLEHPGTAITGLWPKYNDGAKISLPNYLDRWLKVEGLRDAVQTYLDRSRTDLTATGILSSEYPGDLGDMDISYLEMLKLVSLDYHAARMLGLGHIDAPKGAEVWNSPWVYLAVYDTEKDIFTYVEGQAQFRRHMHMSLPTTQLNYRLPPPPSLLPLRYGLYSNEATATPSLLTDANGYSKYDDVRFINLDKGGYPYHIAPGTFWQSTLLFNMSDYTRPVLFGVEYRKSGVASWQNPEISRDAEYLDPAGIPEVVPIPDQDNPLFLHMERDPGIHEYALYGINWFSRASAVSNIRATDTTTFVKRNTLLPPFNVGVQYLQKENPLIFTTQTEQDALTARELATPGGDNTHTRLTFEWNHASHSAYQDADYAEVFFRPQVPRSCAGKIKSHTAPSSGDTFVLRTESMSFASANPPTTVVPAIPIGDESDFIGATLSTAKGQFAVVAVAQSAVAGEGPVFTLKRVNQPVATDADNDGIYVTENRWQPQIATELVGDYFMVVENLNDPAQWTQLTKTVQLIKHSAYSETETYADGSSKVFNYAGVSATATVAHLGEGVYKVSFTTYVLANHPDADVSWYKGSARMLLNVGTLRVATEVWRIDSNGVNPAVIHVYHPDYATQPLKTGSVNVNFHPGYRVYLRPDVAAGFVRGNLLPAPGAGRKTTFMTVRSVDSLGAGLFNRSALTVPVPLLARELLVPIAPSVPVGPTYATRPDFYGKATYTFDVTVNVTAARAPHELMFFRAADRLLLDALYLKATADTVETELRNRKEDGFYSQRWADLVAFNLEADGRFLSHNGYRLPNPNNNKTSALFTGTTNPGANANILAAVKNAIFKSFVPLTPRPVTYAYIKTGKQTSAAEPVIRHPQTGALLKSTDSQFDPSPNVRRYTSGATTKVRFTDFGLDGAARNAYFYYAVEVTKSNERSLPSPVAGPVQLVNAAPAEPPQILKVQSRAANPLAGIKTAVTFEVNSYPAAQNIGGFVLLRANSAANATSARTMVQVGSFLVGQPLVDEFVGLDYPLYGDPLYYRVVALRTIKNESGLQELVPSLPSSAVLTSVVDVLHPAPPRLSYAIGFAGSSPDRLQNVVLSWSATTYKGTYHLSKMTAKGVWRKIYSTAESVSNFQYPPGGDFATYPETALLAKEDSDGNAVYHRFRVDVVNASGMVNVREETLTL
jgi:hypothetical protein